MKIAFCYTKGRPENWAKRAFEGKALGGSEGSMINYAETFASLGHEVSIHTPGARGRHKDGVDWFDADQGFFRRGWGVEDDRNRMAGTATGGPSADQLLGFVAGFPGWDCLVPVR